MNHGDFVPWAGSVCKHLLTYTQKVPCERVCPYVEISRPGSSCQSTRLHFLEETK